MSVSVVIPTYNRSARVVQSIHSVVRELKGRTDYEIVVVDDASTDGTNERLREEFSGEFDSGKLRLIENMVNRGVTGSKNEGYMASKFDWVIFLDSDDSFLQNVGKALVASLETYKDKPLLFFRCIDQKGNFVGKRFQGDVALDLDSYLEHMSYGEALTAVNKRIVQQKPYIESLRGHEGIGCCRIISRYGPAMLSSLVVRRYDCSAADRLSVSTGLFSRMSLIAQGHLMLVHEFGARMRLARRLGYLVKAGAYSVVGTVYRVVEGIRK